MDIDVDKFLTSRWYAFLWAIRFKLEEVANWLLRFVYAQHNARVIIDFENRMMSIISVASGGMMSKPYYTTEAMLSEINRHIEATWQDGYEEGRKTLCEDLGVTDPEKTDR